MSQTSLNSTGVASTGALSLQSNGTTEAIGISTGQVATLAQNPVLTSGTANGVGYLNGSKVLTTGSALTFDGTNLGIGTSSPSRKLTVLGTSGSSVAQISDGVNGTWRFSFSASPALQSITDGGDNKIIAYDNDANNLRFYTLGSEQMRLTSTGLGIGTSSPGSKLNVSGGAVFIDNTVTADYLRFRGSAVGFSGGINASSAVAYLGTYTAHPLVLTINNAAVATFDTAGNLGLGVTPSAWYTGYSNRAFQFGANGALQSLNVSSSDLRVALINNAYDDVSGNNIYLNNGHATKFQSNGGIFKWFTAPSGTAGNAITFTQAMTLDASGNLGVGTTSPNASAIIDAQSTTKGVRFPNMTGTQKNAISSPPAGLVVFDTTLAKLCVYSGSAWQTITSI